MFPFEDENLNNQGAAGADDGGAGDDGDGSGGGNEWEQKAKSLEAELKKKEDELNKLRAKDLNFSSYRKKSEAEKEEIRNSMNARERMLLGQIENLTKKDEAALEEASKVTLKSLSGGDADFEKTIQANFERLTKDDGILTLQQQSERYKEAYALATHQRTSVSNVNPLNQFTPFSSSPNPFNQEKKNYADTPEGQGLAKDLGLTLDKKKA